MELLAVAMDAQTGAARSSDLTPEATGKSPVIIFEWEMPRGELRAGRIPWLSKWIDAWRDSGPLHSSGQIGGELRWFGDIDAHLGYALGAFPRTFEAWVQAIHPEDRARVLAALETHLQTGQPYFEACRLECSDGSWLSCTYSGVATRDTRGVPIKFTATHSNLLASLSECEQGQESSEKARAESLLRTAAHLNAQLELQDVCDAICQEAARTIGAPSAVMLFNSSRDAFVPAATINMPTDYATRYIPTLRSIYDRHVSEMGTLFLFTDAQASPDLPNHQLYTEVNMRTIGIASLIREGEVLGLLKVYSFGESRTFTADELALLQGLADQAAQAIANARYYEQSQRRLANIAALRQIDMAILGSSDINVALNVVLDQTVARLSCDAANVLLLNPHTRTLSHSVGRGFRTFSARRIEWRMGEGLAGRAALERQLLHIADLNFEPQSLDEMAHETSPETARALEAVHRTRLISNESFVSYYALPLIAAGQVKGVLELWHRAPLELQEEDSDFLDTLAGQAAIAIDNATLFGDLQRSNDELMLAYDSTLEGWSGALDLRDKETEGHTQRVTTETVRLAQLMGLTDAELLYVRRGALLHDIGKMGIPDTILLKPGPLTDEEWVVMKKHPTYAYELLSPIGYLRAALDIPYSHHEKWDGSGYPRGLKAEQIPLAARIFAVVDVWDALCSDRPYRKGWPIERVLNHIREGSGTHFDPQVVDAFLQLHAKELVGETFPSNVHD